MLSLFWRIAKYAGKMAKQNVWKGLSTCSDRKTVIRIWKMQARWSDLLCRVYRRKIKRECNGLRCFFGGYGLQGIFQKHQSKLFCRKSSIASMGGRIATNATTFNRELLIVEKSNDGKPFELHTSYADKEKYYRNLRNPWLFLLLLFALFAITKHSIVLGIFSLVSAIPSILYQLQIINVRQKAKTWEQ